MMRARFLQQRAEEARIAAQEAADAYRMFLVGKYKRTYRAFLRYGVEDPAAMSYIRRASEGGDRDAQVMLGYVYRWRHQKT